MCPLNLFFCIWASSNSLVHFFLPFVSFSFYLLTSVSLSLSLLLFFFLRTSYPLGHKLSLTYIEHRLIFTAFLLLSLSLSLSLTLFLPPSPPLSAKIHLIRPGFECPEQKERLFFGRCKMFPVLGEQVNQSATLECECKSELE